MRMHSKRTSNPNNIKNWMGHLKKEHRKRLIKKKMAKKTKQAQRKHK